MALLDLLHGRELPATFATNISSAIDRPTMRTLLKTTG